jgi:hypothetical protein
VVREARGGAPHTAGWGSCPTYRRSRASSTTLFFLGSGHAKKRRRSSATRLEDEMAEDNERKRSREKNRPNSPASPNGWCPKFPFGHSTGADPSTRDSVLASPRPPSRSSVRTPGAGGSRDCGHARAPRRSGSEALGLSGSSGALLPAAHCVATGARACRPPRRALRGRLQPQRSRIWGCGMFTASRPEAQQQLGN